MLRSGIFYELGTIRISINMRLHLQFFINLFNRLFRKSSIDVALIPGLPKEKVIKMVKALSK